MSGDAQVVPHSQKSDATFPPEGAEFVIVSSDEVRFGVTGQFIRQRWVDLHQQNNTMLQMA